MTKNFKDKNVTKVVNINESVSEISFVNSRGISVKLRPLPPYLIQMASTAIDKPEPPTYVVKLEGGGEEIHTHDQESILQSSQEEQTEWSKYLEKVREADQKATEVLINVVLVEGVEVEIPEREKWIKKQKLMGLPVPEDEDELLLMFKKTQVIGNDKDIEFIIQSVMKIGGITEEDLKSVKNSFQDKLESDS